MDDTDKPDSILKQVPLIKNPSYQPPKPVTLNTNYNKLIPTLSNTVVPPKLNISENEVNSWLEEIRWLRDKVRKEQEEKGAKAKYDKWIHDQSIKTAPGFDFSIMQPHKPPPPTTTTQTKEVKQDDGVNELDKIFGKTTLV
ncbi:hypothetical protein SBY92_004040 [Candida maltosa Xu316]